jgi:hypothetical protein
VAAGGVLELAGRPGGYDDLLKAARRASCLPPGKQLRSRPSRRWSPGALELYFDEDFPARVTERPVPVPARVTAWHPAAVAYRQDADRHEVSKDSLSRASRLLHALATEADRRGYDARPRSPGTAQYNSSFASSLKDGQLRICVDGFTYGIRIREQGAGGGKSLPYYGSQRDRLPRWRAVKQTEFIPTGRLQLTLEYGYSRDSRPAEFRDTRTLTLESRLPAVMREIEIRALEDDWKRREEERKAAERQRRWEAAMDQARHDFRETNRAQILSAQLRQWKLVKDIDDYLGQMRQAISSITDEQARESGARWLAWAAGYRDDIDPLQQQLVMPPDPRPQPEDLRPFLRGWSPYGPDAH